MGALPTSWRKQRRVIAIAKRIWMFLVLLVPGFLFLDSILQKRIMTKEILDGFTLESLKLMMAGKKYRVSS